LEGCKTRLRTGRHRKLPLVRRIKFQISRPARHPISKAVRGRLRRAPMQVISRHARRLLPRPQTSQSPRRLLVLWRSRRRLSSPTHPGSRKILGASRRRGRVRAQSGKTITRSTSARTAKARQSLRCFISRRCFSRYTLALRALFASKFVRVFQLFPAKNNGRR